MVVGHYHFRKNSASHGINTKLPRVIEHGVLYTKEILDPYALATVGRNGPGIALNRSSKKRRGLFSPPAMEDAVVVEAHLRDLLWRMPNFRSQVRID